MNTTRSFLSSTWRRMLRCVSGWVPTMTRRLGGRDKALRLLSLKTEMFDDVDVQEHARGLIDGSLSSNTFNSPLERCQDFHSWLVAFQPSWWRWWRRAPWSGAGIGSLKSWSRRRLESLEVLGVWRLGTLFGAAQKCGCMPGDSSVVFEKLDELGWNW